MSQDENRISDLIDGGLIKEKESFHKAKSLTKEEVEHGRSNAYKYLDL